MLAQRWRALTPAYQTAIAGAGLVAVYFTIAFVSIGAFGTNTPIWFANAVAVATLLQVRRAYWPVLLALVYVADVTAMFLTGESQAPLVALADLFETAAAAILILRIGGPAAALVSLAGFAKFILICLAVPIVSATWGGGLLSLPSGGPFLPQFRQWYTASTLGLLVVCPTLLIWMTPALRPSLSSREVREILLLCVGLAILAAVTFGAARPAYLFVTFPAMSILVWRSGFAGVSIGTVVLLSIGLWHTWAGGGALTHFGDPNDISGEIQALQLYLGAVVLSKLPLAVVLADQRRLSLELARVAEARSEFLAAMSHEIRTPMTGVLGMVDLLDSEAPTPRQRAQLKSIRASGKHLVNVLNDILDFSRIETGKLELERIDFSLPLLLEQVQNSLQSLALERGITLSVGLAERSPPIVRGDPTRIQQILLNLTGNAIKFTPKGSVLVLAAYCPDAAGPRFRFEVRDTGIGLAPDQQMHIFDAFTQADHSTSRRYGGSGLGLAISRRLVDRMGGEIGVASKPGEGSLFWFEIPLELGDVVSHATAVSVDPTPIRPCRILLAEDVELNRDIICTILARDGHQVVCAENGCEAVERARDEPFDLILMDVHMPVMDGLDATRAIRAMPGTAGTTPIVALTANVMASEQQKCRQAGMDCVLMKPVEWEQVRAAIRDCTAQRPLGQATAEDPPANRAAEAVAFDDAVFTELLKLIPAPRLKEHAATLFADVARLAEAAPDADPARIRQLAHGIVSQAGMLGLVRLSSRAAAVEHACQTGKALPAGLRHFRAAANDPRDYLLPRLSAPLPGSANSPRAAAAAPPAPAAGLG